MARKRGWSEDEDIARGVYLLMFLDQEIPILLQPIDIPRFLRLHQHTHTELLRVVYGERRTVRNDNRKRDPRLQKRPVTQSRRRKERELSSYPEHTKKGDCHS